MPEFLLMKRSKSSTCGTATTEEKRKTRKKEAAGATAKHDTFYRFAEVESGTADDAARTIQVAFSSETPVRRKAGATEEELGIARKGEYYYEVLSHNEGDADLTALNNTGAFLDEHDDAQHLGAVRAAQVSKDKIGRAVLEFDEASDLSTTRFKQMGTNRSRPHISFGYNQTKFLGDDVMDGKRVKRIAWAADEISSVARPADPTVGVSRSAAGEWRCIGCGGAFSTGDLDENYRCEDCGIEMMKASKDGHHKAAEGSNRLVRRLPEVFLDRNFRVNRSDASAETISHNSIKSAVSSALSNDDRFKKTTESGDKYSSFYIHDIEEDEDGNYRAIVYDANYEMSAAEFDFDGEHALIGEVYPVQWKGAYEKTDDGGEDRSHPIYFIREADCEELTLDMQLVRGDGKEPYGGVEYADPGYQTDKKKRYPINTKAHAKAAWNYINKKKNAGKYTSQQLSHIKGKIKAACKKFGVDCGSEDSSRKGAETQKIRTEDDEGNKAKARHEWHQLTRILETNLPGERHLSDEQWVEFTRGMARVGVDSEKLSDAEYAKTLNTDQKAMLRKFSVLWSPAAADGGTAVDTAEVERKARSAERVVVENEVKTRTEEVTKKRTARNTELTALETEMRGQYKGRWNGKPGEVFIVEDRIQLLAEQARNAPDSQDAAEVRKDFKDKVRLAAEGSYLARKQENIGVVDNSLARRCSLRSIYNSAVKAEGAWKGTYRVTEGAEFESDREIRGLAKYFPDGEAGLGAGIQLPLNMPVADLSRGGHSRRKLRRMTRDALAGDFPTAGALVAPEFIFPTIELLRNMPAMARAGITFLTGVMGNLVLPRQVAPTTPQSLAEGAALLQYDQTLDQIRMSPHRVGSSQNYSRLALLQTTPDFEALVMQDHLAQIALWMDQMILNGQGANDQPLGILNQLGIGVVTFGGSAINAYKNTVALETAIRVANIYEECSFITSSTVRGTLRVTPAVLTGSTIVSGTTNSLWEGADDGEELIGRPAVDSQQVPNNVLVALVGRHVLCAQWGGLAVVLDTVTRANQDEYRLSINTYMDVALRHAQAVARSTDSLAVLN